VAEIITFPGPRRRKRGKMRNKGKTLCKSEFHRWQTDQQKQFDVRQGLLVTIRRCIRCGYTRTTHD